MPTLYESVAGKRFHFVPIDTFKGTAFEISLIFQIYKMSF